jgi:hypothetical protein
VSRGWRCVSCSEELAAAVLHMICLHRYTPERHMLHMIMHLLTRGQH